MGRHSVCFRRRRVKTLQTDPRGGGLRAPAAGPSVQGPDPTPTLHLLRPAMPDRFTSKQRAHLRSLAHGQDPLIHIGKEGLTEAVEEAIEEAFNTRELVTIRVLDNAPREVRDLAEAVAGTLDDVQVVETRGGTALLYRPDPDEPEIVLPEPGTN